MNSPTTTLRNRVLQDLVFPDRKDPRRKQPSKISKYEHLNLLRARQHQLDAVNPGTIDAAYELESTIDVLTRNNSLLHEQNR